VTAPSIAWNYDDAYAQVSSPTDAEIVAAFGAYKRASDAAVGSGPRCMHLPVAGHLIAMDHVQRAWSRELKRRIAEKAYASRLPCRGDYLEEHEGTPA
jgi:hypothetical protein